MPGLQGVGSGGLGRQLELDEIVRWYRRARTAREYRNDSGTRAVPISAFCDFAGVPKSNFYAIVRGDLGMTRNYRARISQAILAVEAGLRWRKTLNGYVIVDEKKWQRLPRYERRPKHRDQGEGMQA